MFCVNETEKKKVTFFYLDLLTYYKKVGYGYFKSTLHCLHDIHLSEKQEKDAFD